MPQGREIFPLLTVRENLQTGFAPLPRALRNIPDEIFHLFPVLKDMLGRRGGDLSGGQQQQLAIARALVTRPRLLVLDEPTASLDVRHDMEILELLRASADHGMTVFLITHHLDLAARFADRLLLLDRGRVAAEGEPQEVLREETLERVYEWPISVSNDPATGVPRVTPLSTSSGLRPPAPQDQDPDS